MKRLLLSFVFATAILSVPVVAHAAKPPAKQSTSAKAQKATKGPSKPAKASKTKRKPLSAAARANKLKAKKIEADRQKKRQAQEFDPNKGAFARMLNRLKQPWGPRPYNKTMSISSSGSDGRRRTPLPPRGRYAVYFASTTANAGDIYETERPRERGTP